MNTRKIIHTVLCLVAALGFTACYNDFDEPATDGYQVTATGLPEPNTTLCDVKARFCADNASAGTSQNASNFWTRVGEDLVFEGTVVANDISGNLYQSVVLRDFGTEGIPGSATDQSITLGIKNTCLYPFFHLGQRVRVNLNGLYVGCYSKAPKIGTPYFTSAGNNRLGPMLFDVLRTNIELIGEPDAHAPELVPVDLTGEDGKKWIADNANQTWKNCPMLATVEGRMKEVQGAAARNPEAGTEDSWAGVYEDIISYTNAAGETEYSKIYAPKCLRDAGYCVDRTIITESAGKTVSVTLRTGTGNSISFLVMPLDSRKYTGVMSYYSGWQVVLRDTDDIYPPLDPTLGTSGPRP